MDYRLCKLKNDKRRKDVFLIKTGIPSCKAAGRIEIDCLMARTGYFFRMEQPSSQDVFKSYPAISPVGKPLFFSTLFLSLGIFAFFMVMCLALIGATKTFLNEIGFELKGEEMHLVLDDQEIVINWERLVETDGREGASQNLTKGQRNDLEEKASHIIENSTFGILTWDELQGLEEEDVLALMLQVAGVVILLSLLTLPFWVVSYMIIFKAWKALQPIKTLRPELGGVLIDPVLALVFFFIPLLNLVWPLIMFCSLPKRGRVIAETAGIPYRGPGMALGVSYSILSGINIVISFVVGLSIVFIPLFLFFWITSVFVGICIFVLYIVLMYKMRDMVEDFSAIWTKKTAI